MPWQEVVTVELRQQFVQDALRRVVPVAELCGAYGISRKTGYKFMARYVGLVEIDDSEWDVYFGPLRLGRFHERTLLIEDALGRHYRRRY